MPRLDEWINLYENPQNQQRPAPPEREVQQGPYEQWYIQNIGPRQTGFDRSIPYGTEAEALRVLTEGEKPRPPDQPYMTEVQKLMAEIKDIDPDSLIRENQYATGANISDEVPMELRDEFNAALDRQVAEQDPEEDTQHLDPEDSEEYDDERIEDLTLGIQYMKEKIESEDMTSSDWHKYKEMHDEVERHNWFKARRRYLEKRGE